MKETSGGCAGSCGCMLAILLFNVVLGAWTFSYDLWVLAGKTAPWWANVICGLLGGEVTVPLALILWVLSAAGVIHGPLVR